VAGMFSNESGGELAYLPMQGHLGVEKGDGAVLGVDLRRICDRIALDEGNRVGVHRQAVKRGAVHRREGRKVVKRVFLFEHLGQD